MTLPTRLSPLLLALVVASPSSLKAGELAIAEVAALMPELDEALGPVDDEAVFTPLTATLPRVAAALELNSYDGPALTDTSTGRAVAELLRDRTVQDVQLLRAESQLSLRAGMRLLGAAAPGQLEIESVEQHDVPGGRGWVAALAGPGDEVGELILVERPESTYGILERNGQLSTLRKLGGTLYALTASTPGDRDRDDVRGVPPPPPPAAPGGEPIRPASCNEPLTGQLEIVIGFTPLARSKAAAAGFDLHDRISVAELLSERSLDNSGLDVELVLSEPLEVEYDEAETSFDDDLSALDSSAAFERLRRERRTQYGDVLVLVRHHDDPSHCGLVQKIGATQANEALAVVNWQCLADKYSFVHEIGHLVGAWHDPESLLDPTQVAPPWAMGFTSKAGHRFATVMAYRDACSPCGRISFWSNPNTRYRNVPTGSDRNDNACIWKKNLPTLAALGDAIPPESDN